MIDHHCVTHGQRSKEIVYRLGVLVIFRRRHRGKLKGKTAIIFCLLHLALPGESIADGGHRAVNHALPLENIRLRIPVDLLPHVTLLKLHLVLGQGACFVRKDELNLAQLLNQITISAQSKIHVIWLCEEHLHIIVN